jgi:hypothetical protein
VPDARAARTSKEFLTLVVGTCPVLAASRSCSIDTISGLQAEMLAEIGQRAARQEP